LFLRKEELNEANVRRANNILLQTESQQSHFEFCKATVLT